MSRESAGRNAYSANFPLKMHQTMLEIALRQRFTQCFRENRFKFMDMLPDHYSFAVYLGVFLGPFVQEDAAVFAAAGLAVNGIKQTVPLYFVLLAGLILSDIWKYWIGWAALKNERARAWTERKHVAQLKDGVKGNLLITLFSARFIPLARIPTYAACGYFGVNYAKFCAIIALTAAVYAFVVFTACHLLGQVMGEQLKWILPILGLVAAAIVLFLVMRNRRKETG